MAQRGGKESTDDTQGIVEKAYVLVIYTGGTIGMMESPDGKKKHSLSLVPAMGLSIQFCYANKQLGCCVSGVNLGGGAQNLEMGRAMMVIILVAGASIEYLLQNYSC